MTPASEERLAATELGDFSLTEKLGEGGSGTVYAAWWHDRPVALKVLKESVTVTDKDRARFVDEATKIRKVEHPALVSVLDAGTLPDGRPYLAMPRLHGETLHQRTQRGALPVGEAVALFSALAAGVAALHAAGMVHRDIKPENVFLEDMGDGPPRPVLLDFGIAREVDWPDSTTTQSGVVKGTPAYMAPERFFGSPASVRTDVYELAVTLYVMFAGALPWDASSQDASGRLDPRPPSSKGARVPSGVETALLRAMSTRPEMRPPSAAAFAREIEAGLAAGDAAPPRRTSDVAITPPSPPPVASTTGAAFVATGARPTSRTRLAVVGVLAVAGALALGLLRREGPTQVVVPEESRATATPPPAAIVTSPTAAVPVATAVPTTPASYVIPPRYQPRPRAVAAADAAPPADPSRFYQDRK